MLASGGKRKGEVHKYPYARIMCCNLVSSEGANLWLLSTRKYAMKTEKLSLKFWAHSIIFSLDKQISCYVLFLECWMENGRSVNSIPAVLLSFSAALLHLHQTTVVLQPDYQTANRTSVGIYNNRTEKSHAHGQKTSKRRLENLYVIRLSSPYHRKTLLDLIPKPTILHIIQPTVARKS